MILSAHGLGRKGKEKNLETARKPPLFIHRGAVARTITPLPSRAGEATFCRKKSSSVPNHVTASQGKESPQLRAGPVPTTAEHQPTCSARRRERLNRRRGAEERRALCGHRPRHDRPSNAAPPAPSSTQPKSGVIPESTQDPPSVIPGSAPRPPGVIPGSTPGSARDSTGTTTVSSPDPPA